MFPRVCCLVVKGGMLVDEVCDVLYDTAQEMVRRGVRKRKLKVHDMEGQVRTKFRHAHFGSVSGIVFEADVETDERTYQVSFVIEPSKIRSDQGVWEEWDDPGVADLPADPAMN